MGERRIGLAVSDPGGMLATPLGFIERKHLPRDIAQVVVHARDRGAERIVVGMPLSLNGRVGPQARRVEAFLKALRRRTDLPVDAVDERFSTAEAERLLRLAGRQPSRNRGQADAAAAAVILQGYLDSRRDRISLSDVSHEGDTVL